MKKRISFALALTLVIAFVLGACGSPASSSSGTPSSSDAPSKAPLSGQLSIGTASMGGAFYPVGQSIANMVTQYSGGLTMTPEVTGGAVENCRLVNDGDVDIALTNENHAYAAVHGLEPFTGINADLNVVASLYSSVLHIMVPEDSNINSISDMKGKRVAVGPAGGGSIAPLEAILAAYGMTLNDIVPSYLAYNDGFTQLSDGNVDVALAMAGFPTSAVMEYAATKAVKFVNIEDSNFDTILSTNPYFSKIVVPADTYNMKADGIAVGINNVLIVRADMDPDVVYAITASMFDHLEEFIASNANVATVTLEAASKASVTIHPGAQRYYDEH